jgi:sulfopyruvate decarboxylase subunit alpha
MNTRATVHVTSVRPELILDAIRGAGITDVITVPDTHQRSLLDLLAAGDDPRLLQVCTEDEAMGVNLGLYMGGRKPLVLIQNTGFFASMNSIRGVALDACAPAVLLIGEFTRDPAVAPNANAQSVVRLLQPTLDAWEIPTFRLDGDDDLVNIGKAVDEAWARPGPVAVIVGAPTSAPSPTAKGR